MYREDFQEAVDRTIRFGLAPPSFSYSNEVFLTNERQATFAYALRDRVGEFTPNELVARCISISQYMMGPISEIFGTDCLYTIGYIETNERTLFKQSEAELRNMMEEGIEGTDIAVHAWLTLPSMEIIDLTLGTSFAMIHNNPNEIGSVIAKHPDELIGGLKYRPMLIGEDYISKVFRIS